ncbi:MAG: LamG domain-containing protein [Planctomycetota bacterium]|jgi:hypothetical protein
MKRALMVVLLVQVGLFVCGCKKRPEEAPSAKPEPALTRPAPAVKTERVEPDVSRGLVAWWKFDDASGKAAADSSGNGHKGTLMGRLSFDGKSVEGRIGKALEFDGAEGYIEIEGYKGVTGTRPRTVAAWIKTKSDNGRILSWGRDEGGGMFIFGHVQGRGRIGVTPEGGYLYMNKKTNDDAWHHVAAVVEEAELPNLHDHVTIFLDGEVAEIHDIGILDLWPIETPAGQDVTIGKGFKGALDDVRIYDRALTEDEIRLLFTPEKR